MESPNEDTSEHDQRQLEAGVPISALLVGWEDGAVPLLEVGSPRELFGVVVVSHQLAPDAPSEVKHEQDDDRPEDARDHQQGPLANAIKQTRCFSALPLKDELPKKIRQSG